MQQSTDPARATGARRSLWSKPSSRIAARKHQAAMKKGETCIDCHKGVARALPAGHDADEAEGEGEAAGAGS